MIIDKRTYVLQPGTVPEYFKLYEAQGLEVQQRILGNLIGYFATEVGTQNEVMHLWGYESLDDRERRRAELGADPDWQAYLAKVRPLIVRMENAIIKPAPFSPIR